MKKFLSLVLAIALVLMFAGCKNAKDTSSGASSTLDADKKEDFVKPEKYATVVLVTINPQLKFYLDEYNDVLAIEPVNEDAKEIIKEIKFEKKNFNDFVEDVVTISNQKGFIKESGTVNFEVVEKLDQELNTVELLKAADSTVKEFTVKNEIEITVQTSDTTHEHVYAEATCVKAASCDCGATKDEALGHSFNSGKCSRCGEKDPDFVPSYSSVKTKAGVWRFKYVTDATYANATLVLCGDEIYCAAGFGDDIDAMTDIPPEDREIMKNDTSGTVVYNGRYYWVARGTGACPIASVEESEGTITVTDPDGNKLILIRTSETTMKIASSPTAFSQLDVVPLTGTILTFSAE